ncbi:MAG: DUF1844 domain-containing protein [Candidatus Marinimicrobia bacterium]|jgi:hypothetical protein|nr:DUF1844 domain-containing protein [Candidatus Neomarinimicrobiota bacterium]MCK9483428.1 DUF1844 domain-containing protein [Candidatus Neomarinimicrobiota bacterium]MCK9560375.1 DUF1844 domain-containing protein [Candidatus Neomarinimicrobiota bacterium]MDD5230622.1 DUF1844 domain-containing protein [Candidatus Neomarinimicrobiota bacterium]MDD5540006.1 DUF1844 domain-containing protein [Candidatus Neomarinimicrobiota bacterium]
MTDNQPDRQQILFLSLVQSLVSSAWIQLGKMKNPGTGAAEIKLEEASITIDMLEMLLNKTKGNLADDEKRFLERALSDLKMNFVEAKLKAPTTEKPTGDQSKSQT